MSTKKKSVAIVGGGIAGLSAAVYLHSDGHQVVVYEKDSRMGGRVATESIDGYQLDLGFQVFLTAYPEAKRLLDYSTLNFGFFDPGAMIIQGASKRSGVWDVMRLPGKLFDMVFQQFAAPSDLYRIWALRAKLKRLSIEEILSQPESSTLAFLKDFGFSNRIIDQFFKPFYTGIFLEPHLETSSRMFCFVFKMFGEGFAALPAGGIGNIPAQLVNRLPKEALKTNQTVIDCGSNYIKTADSQHFYDAVIIAADLNQYKKNWHHTGVVYFSAAQSPFRDPAIALLTDTGSIINSISVLSDVASGYAPDGKSLISVALKNWPEQLSSSEVMEQVKMALALVIPESNQWVALKAYRIDKALPENIQLSAEPPKGMLPDAHGVFHCGDHLVFGSLNAAMLSGRLAAEAVMKS
jgi:hypothetical protein